METLSSDDRIEWPDTFSQEPGGAIVFTLSHIHHMPRFNKAKSTRTRPYAVFRIGP
ncbi:MAG TPA: hypothetical protein VE621_11830 [Bryobacteraceae bacterium]|nr:hypothetical protein [Bryobacteraceae bacterium]